MIGHPVVGIKSLNGWMELETFNTKRFNQAFCFPRTQSSLVRINAGKRYHHVTVLARQFSHFFIRNSFSSELMLSIDREHDESYFQTSVIVTSFLNGRAVIHFEIFLECFVELGTVVIMRLTATYFGVRMNVDGNHLA